MAIFKITFINSLKTYSKETLESLSSIVSSATLLALICLYILIVPAFLLSMSTKKEASRATARYNEMQTLTAEYKELKERLDIINKQKTLTKISGTTQAADSILASLGLKGKMKSFKALGSRELPGGSEETADIYLEKVNINELVNIFHAFENAPMAVSIKKTNMKKSFERPELLDITIELSLFSEK